jgi:hypothetical protein
VAGKVEVWVDDGAGARLPFVDRAVSVDLAPGSGWTSLETQAEAGATGETVPDDIPPGTYFLRARISSSDGEVLSANTYELVVPDVAFGWLDHLSGPEVATLLDGAPGAHGFHYWHGGAVAYRAEPGLRGFLAGWRQAESRGIDLYETVQGEHLFRHVLAELPGVPGAGPVLDDVWTIRSEILSPAVKARTLLRYVEHVVRRAEALVDSPGRRPSRQAKAVPQPRAGRAVPDPPARFFPVGRDVRPVPPDRTRRQDP